MNCRWIWIILMLIWLAGSCETRLTTFYVKAGNSEEGSKAASSHTGAMATSNIFVQALFNKAGIIRCQSRYELITLGAILQKTQLKLS